MMGYDIKTQKDPKSDISGIIHVFQPEGRLVLQVFRGGDGNACCYGGHGYEAVGSSIGFIGLVQDSMALPLQDFSERLEAMLFGKKKPSAEEAETTGQAATFTDSELCLLDGLLEWKAERLERIMAYQEMKPACVGLVMDIQNIREKIARMREENARLVPKYLTVGDILNFMDGLPADTPVACKGTGSETGAETEAGWRPSAVAVDKDGVLWLKARKED